MSGRPAPKPDTPAYALPNLFLIAVGVTLALLYTVPPAVVPQTASPAEFSAMRAFEHLKVIARDSHPTGSARNAQVRDYLIKQLETQGVEAQVQRTGTASRVDIFPGPYAAGTVENVVGRLKGAGSTGAVLLMAHYDSVAAGPGATDDGSGVVTLLETLRALKSGPPLLNDLIFLFTDGHELGMVGAQGFVDEHPWAKDVPAIWNLDGGGSCGPAGLDIPNGWALREFKKVVPRPLTSSIGSELAKLGPPDADDRIVFNQAGLTKARAGYSGCRPRYHTAKDDLENIDLRSVQHLGIYTLAVVRDWGNLDLKQIPAVPDSVFFVIPGRIVSYPVTFVRPISVLLAIVFAIVLMFGFRRARLRLSGLAIGILLWLAATLLCAALVAALWSSLKFLDLVNSSYSSTYNAELYAVGLLALTIATTSALYRLCRRRINGDDLTMGGLFWYLMLAALTGWFAPGASFPFALPLGFGLLSLVLSFRFDRSTMLSSILRVLCALPAVFLFTLLIAVITINLEGDPRSTLVAGVILTVILLAFLAPQLDAMTRNSRLSVIFAVMGVALLILGATHSGYDGMHPQPDSVAYWLDADTGRTFWISLDDKPDSWTSQFLTGHIKSDELNMFVSPGGEKVLKTTAPPAPLPAPQLVLLDDSSSGNERMLRLRIKSERQPETLWISVRNATIIRATVDGKKLPSKMIDPDEKLWGFYYAAPPSQGIELKLSFDAGEKPQITLTDQTLGLPEITGFHARPRTQDLMPLHYYPAFDSTILVSKTFAP